MTATLGVLPVLGVLTLSIYLACAIGVLVALGRMADSISPAAASPIWTHA
jgi:hypothetical protein